MENYLVSARKYRPSTFDSVVGQKALTATLKNAVASNRLAHSYLFCGSRGVGKTSCARIFAKTINCEHRTANGEACNECESCRDFNSGASMNIIELDAASNNGIEDMRTLIEQVQVAPARGRYRVFIIDEVHMLSTAAFNAFLKTLEEPPSYVIFILATTEKHKIIPTILSRCQIYDFHRITIQDMIDHLSYVAKCEGITAEQSALNVIAQKADGAMRDALSIFDQVAASTRGNITYQSAIDNLNVLDYEYYNRLLDAFLAGDVLRSWTIYKEIRDRGFDSQFFINGLANYFRDLLVARDPSTITLIEAGEEARNGMAARAVKCDPDFLLRAMALCNDADLNYRVASNKQFLVEVTLAKICQLLSPSPSNKSGNGEGQLKPIAPAANTQTQTTPPTTQPPVQAPQQAAPKSTSPAAPAPAPTPATSTRTASFGTPHAPTHKNSAGQRPNVPRISIKHHQQDVQRSDAPTAPATPTEARTTPFTADALTAAWNTYIATHPSAHILINTMRASQPKGLTGNRFSVTVENEMQLQLMNENRPDILAHLHNSLANDTVDYAVDINTGPPSRHTLSDRELLATLVEEHPTLKKFIKDFDLKLA